MFFFIFISILNNGGFNNVPFTRSQTLNIDIWKHFPLKFWLSTDLYHPDNFRSRRGSTVQEFSHCINYLFIGLPFFASASPEYLLILPALVFTLTSSFFCNNQTAMNLQPRRIIIQCQFEQLKTKKRPNNLSSPPTQPDSDRMTLWFDPNSSFR